MAAGIYRYAWKELTVSDIESSVPSTSIPVTITGPSPVLQIDVKIADAADKPDLDDVMSSLGWVFVSAFPTGDPQGIVLRSWNEAVQSADVTTNSAVFVNLLNIPIIPVQAAGRFEITASLTSTVIGSLNYFRLTVDGVPLPNSGFGHAVGVGSAEITQSILVAPGPHTVGLQWRVDALGQADIRPVTMPDLEGCRLAVNEYSS